WFLYLRVPHAELERRGKTRHHRYMSPSLPDSQLETLEEPPPDKPRTIAVQAQNGIETTLDAALQSQRDDGAIGG
ncbi:MAG: hypothetical protein C4338_01905, partial [Rhodanobacteraceae bacterium]